MEGMGGWMKKMFSSLAAAVLMLSLFVPSMAAVETNQATELELSQSLFSMTEARTV